ncbi:gastrula zinc finger protein XlCGF66.1 [Calliphora vicina]|uniref:gastrula zinc finger protein XlCGF66.1 n=1 Tax=Calliphora vicina TaxID=7373 RepID=UPI00325AB1F2
MATTKTPKDVFVLNCNEIPETICVETRFITQSAAKQKKNEQIYYITNKNGSLEMSRQEDQQVSQKNAITIAKPTTVTLSIQTKQGPTQPVPLIQQTTGTIVPLASALTNQSNKELITSCNTNVVTNLSASKNTSKPTVTDIPQSNTSQLQITNVNASVLPVNSLGATSGINMPIIRCNFNDQVQQTDVSTLNMKSIAIQCKLDEELDDVWGEWLPMTEEPLVNGENSETVMDNFRKFVEDNSTQHKDYKECLICGEIGKSNKYFYGHMSIHRGPRVLCFKCGQYLDNENLLLQHKCGKVRQLEKAFLQCPHHGCSVVAISRLELYDHINEHDNNRMYKCSACRKGFCTGQEFLRHILIRGKCYTTAKRKRFRVYGLESQKDRLCRVRVFTLHTFKKRTTLVKTFLSQRVAKQGVCKICLRSFTNISVFNRHRSKCLTKFRKRLIRKRRARANA